jgi:hypothetical protein
MRLTAAQQQRAANVCFGWKADVRSDRESHKLAANSLSRVALATAVGFRL